MLFDTGGSSPIAVRGWNPAFLEPKEASARCLADSVRGGGGGGGGRVCSFVFADAPFRIFSNAFAAFFFDSASDAVYCFAVGGTPDEKRVCHLCAPDGVVRGLVLLPLLRRGGGGYCALTFDHGLPLTPEAPGKRPRPREASCLAFCSGSERISCAVWMIWNWVLTSCSRPGLRSGWYLRAAFRVSVFEGKEPYFHTKLSILLPDLRQVGRWGQL